MTQSAQHLSSHLLIIDKVRDLSHQLEPKGYHLTCVSTAREALKALGVGSIDAVLLDLDLSESEGLDVLGEIRKHSAIMPVVLMAREDGIDRALGGLQRGANCLLRRPFHHHELAHCLDCVRERAALRREVDQLRQGQAGGGEGASSPASSPARSSQGAPLSDLEAVMHLLRDPQSSLAPLREARDLFEKTYLSEILRRTGGNVTRASRLAGRNRTDFYELLRRHQLSASLFKG